MTTKNRKIPLPIQREVRQRCGYGCVICGFPLCDYHHIKGWAKVQEHRAEDITLLCKNHHGQATTGILPEQKIDDANKKPINIVNGYSQKYPLYFYGESCEIEIGTNLFQSSLQGVFTFLSAIMIDGDSILGFTIENDRLLLNILLFDENNNPILQIQNNILVFSVEPWDIQFIGTKLIIREKHKKILIHLNFQPPNRVIVEKARILRNGVEIRVDNNQIVVGESQITMQGNRFINIPVGIMIGENRYKVGSGIYLPNPKRIVKKNE